MSRVLQIAAWGLVIAATCTSEAQAQRWGVTFGGGGVRIGVGSGRVYGPGYYGPGYYGPGYYGSRYYGPGYYRPGYGPVIVAPQPQQVYVQPQYVPSAPTRITDGGEILLFNPSSSGATVQYTLNGQPYTMPPGTKQRFVNDRPWTIRFESSPGLVATYSLNTGRYKFKPQGAGIGLFATQDMPESAPPALPPAPTPNLGTSAIPPQPAR